MILTVEEHVEAMPRPVATALPLIRWRGWRPLPLDLSSAEQGGQAFLVLEREGDLALLPTATLTFICYEPLGDGTRWEDHGVSPVEVTHSDAVQRQVVLQAVTELTGDGWHVLGRLHATFHGIDTEDDFWERLDWSTEAAQ
jgi:hypothetical protein